MSVARRRGESSVDGSSNASSNLFFASLPAAAQRSLLASSRSVSHPAGDVLFRSGEPVLELSFPLSGIVSLTIDTNDGQGVEVALSGVEAMVGVNRYLGAQMAATNAVVQVAGDVMHVPVDAVLKDGKVFSALRPAVDLLVSSQMIELAQSALCNKIHSVEQRTARWLLTASDRAHTTDLRLTHEFLAQMLAVRRASVTDVVGSFSRPGLIDARRGLISIIDRAGLRAMACECYEVVRAATPRYD